MIFQLKNFLVICTIFCACVFTSDLFAQQSKGQISGTVLSEEGKPLADAYVFLKNTNYHTTTDKEGFYHLAAPAGDYKVICTSIGYINQVRDIVVQTGQTNNLSLTLAFDPNMILDEVTVAGKSIVEEVNESAYNVVAIDAGKLKNSSMDLSQAMEKVSGIRIRRSGGQGSRTSIMLNGFSGKHVKVFMDGIPMNNFGPAFNINNIPINLADRIEIYKGVVPIELGSDALGGAINIVTKKTSNTYLDASYSYGSFNTHKSSINFGSTSRSGFTFSINAFQSYSDNNYKVKSLLLDVNEDGINDGVYSTEEYWFRRFHDTYHNESVVGKIGVQKKPWADRLLLGLTLSQMEADIQHANIMKIVYGGRKREATTIMPSLEYFKNNLFVKDLTFSLTANYSQVNNVNIDTVARQYNWNGEYRIKSSKGEGDYSLGKYSNNSGVATANLTYSPNDKHHFALNNVFSTYARKNTDEKATAETGAAIDSIKRSNLKNVLGISYRYQVNKKWNTAAFGKNYFVSVTGPVDTTSTTTAQYERQTRSFNTTGYGLVTNYQLTPNLLLKASFEKTYRLPSETELFGDEVLEVGTVTLKAENSNNVNFNVSYNPSFGKSKLHSINLDAGFIYRDTRDYIRRQIEQKYGGAYYTNHGKVLNLGIDLEAKYYYNNQFSLGGNMSYQNIRNMEEFSPSGQKLIYYKDRMPNLPYLFGNAFTSYEFTGKQGNSLTVSYFLNYVHEFFRQWESEGGSRDKKVIPEQLSHDLALTYILKNGRYNISLEVQNLTDELLYDNYSLQKPGRSFSAKLRYYFTKHND
ncbi:TonB-dependent receptor [Limibacter armeniacum]|uniref:TonB-dependent receptor n=1 Tax=Limibacter armeniacum TaxID=466084 RepID=UPI002FE5DD89